MNALDPGSHDVPAGAADPDKARKAGESDERLFAVAAWREALYYSEAERAALALAEAVTRLSDRGRPGPRRDLGRGGPPL